MRYDLKKAIGLKLNCIMSVLKWVKWNMASDGMKYESLDQHRSNRESI